MGAFQARLIMGNRCRRTVPKSDIRRSNLRDQFQNLDVRFPRFGYQNRTDRFRPQGGHPDVERA